MKHILIFLVKFYQTHLSCLKSAPSCRFIPTCSEYAVQALTKYGVIKGTYLAIRRLLKCHPFHKGGYDPLP